MALIKNVLILFAVGTIASAFNSFGTVQVGTFNRNFDPNGSGAKLTKMETKSTKDGENSDGAQSMQEELADSLLLQEQIIGFEGAPKNEDKETKIRLEKAEAKLALLEKSLPQMKEIQNVQSAVKDLQSEVDTEIKAVKGTVNDTVKSLKKEINESVNKTVQEMKKENKKAVKEAVKDTVKSLKKEIKESMDKTVQEMKKENKKAVKEAVKYTVKSLKKEIKESVDKTVQEMKKENKKEIAKVARKISQVQKKITTIVKRNELITEAGINCKENFQGFGNSCYLFSDDTLNWKEAKTKCEQLGTHLVVINDGKEDKFLKKIARIRGNAVSYYVGASDVDSEGNWQWVDSKKNPYTNWYPDQPSGDRRQNCLNLWARYGFGWDDEICSESHKYICEYQM